MGKHLPHVTMTVLGTSSSMCELDVCAMVESTMFARNVGQQGLSSTCCNHGRSLGAVLLSVVETEEMGEARSVGGSTVGAVSGDAAGENDSCGWRRIVIRNLSSAISAWSSTISHWGSKLMLDVWGGEDLGGWGGVVLGLGDLAVRIAA